MHGGSLLWKEFDGSTMVAWADSILYGVIQQPFHHSILPRQRSEGKSQENKLVW